MVAQLCDPIASRIFRMCSNDFTQDIEQMFTALMLEVLFYFLYLISRRKPSYPCFINRSPHKVASTHLHSSLLWVKAVSGWDVWSARGAISIAQELKDFYCVACVLFFLSALLSPPSFRFVLWDFFLCFGLPSSEIGFLLCFRTPRFCRPLPHAASALCTQTRRSLFEDNIIQNTSRFPSFLCLESLILRAIFHLPPVLRRAGGKRWRWWNLSHICKKTFLRSRYWASTWSCELLSGPEWRVAMKNP